MCATVFRVLGINNFGFCSTLYFTTLLSNSMTSHVKHILVQYKYCRFFLPNSSAILMLSWFDLRMNNQTFPKFNYQKEFHMKKISLLFLKIIVKLGEQVLLWQFLDTSYNNIFPIFPNFVKTFRTIPIIKMYWIDETLSKNVHLMCSFWCAPLNSTMLHKCGYTNF